MKSKKSKLFILMTVMFFSVSFLTQYANASCEYKYNGECEFKCDATPNETCKGEATVAGNKTRVTCDGKEIECPDQGVTP